MNLQIEQSISEIADRARARYEAAIRDARRSTEQAAGRVVKGKKPVRTISKLGVKLSDVSHKTANKLWRRQTKLVEGQIDAVAKRLKAVAHAENWKDLVETQIRLIPENTALYTDEARQAFEIVKGAGGEIRDLVAGTVAELRGQKAATRKASSRKAKAPTQKANASPRKTSSPNPAVPVATVSSEEGRAA